VLRKYRVRRSRSSLFQGKLRVEARVVQPTNQGRAGAPFSLGATPPFLFFCTFSGSSAPFCLQVSTPNENSPFRPPRVAHHFDG
jgi:hypothetical protein